MEIMGLGNVERRLSSVEGAEMCVLQGQFLASYFCKICCTRRSDRALLETV